MIVIYGHRLYGKVDVCDGEFAATRFAHVYWLPIFPVGGTTWFTARKGTQYFGHAMRLSWKSIAAAYLRSWGLLFGLIFTNTAVRALLGYTSLDPLAPLLLGVPLLAASLYTWRWYRVSAAERERLALCAAVTDTYCAPERLPTELASSLRQNIENTWAARYPLQTPGDVARFGSRDPQQSLLAYVLLRLHARDATGARFKELRELAEQVASNTPRDTISGDGIYRSLVQANIQAYQTK